MRVPNVFISFTSFWMETAAVDAIVPCTLPDESKPFAQQMRTLSNLADYAMRMARVAVQQCEALLTPRPETTASPAQGGRAQRLPPHRRPPTQWLCTGFTWRAGVA